MSENEEKKRYYDYDKASDIPNNTKEGQVGESPLSKSAPSTSWIDESGNKQQKHKRGLSQDILKDASTNVESMIRQFQSNTSGPPPQEFGPSGRKAHQGTYRQPPPPQQQRHRMPPPSHHHEQSPYYGDSNRSNGNKMDQLSMNEIHAIIEENRSLHNELEGMSHQFQMEKMDFIRRLRHLTSRVEYLEGLKCTHSSPDLNNDMMKPYQSRRQPYRQYNKPSSAGSSRSRRGSSSKPTSTNTPDSTSKGFNHDEDCVTNGEHYAPSESPDALIHSENNNNNNKSRRRPPYDYSPRMRMMDTAAGNRYMQPPPPLMFAPPPPPPFAAAAVAANQRFEEERMVMNDYYHGRFYNDDPQTEDEEEMEDSAAAAMTEMNARRGNYGPPLPPPNMPAPMMGGPPLPPPPPFMGPPMMQGPPPPMGYRQQWNDLPFTESRYRNKSRYTSSQPASEDEEEEMMFRQREEEDQDMQMRFHQMSMNNMGPMGPPPPPPPMMHMYDQVLSPFIESPKYNGGSLRRVSSRRSAPGNVGHGGSSRSPFINGSR